ncbi:MAG: hypothetical protein H6Q67_1278 [Firmicutes bacterium]|nr:hypothetical protein [Bacillota bacterium]
MRAYVWIMAFILAIMIHSVGLVLAGHSILSLTDFNCQHQPDSGIEVALEQEQDQPEVYPKEQRTAPDTKINSLVTSISNGSQTRETPWESNTTVMSSTDYGSDGTNQQTAGILNANQASAGSVSTGSSVAAEDTESVDSQPQPKYCPEVEYPRIARLNKWQGTVMVTFLVTKAGNVGSIRLLQSSGYELLDNTVTRQMYRWRFIPAYRKGQPVDYMMKKSTTFRLQD